MCHEAADVCNRCAAAPVPPQTPIAWRCGRRATPHLWRAYGNRPPAAPTVGVRAPQTRGVCAVVEAGASPLNAAGTPHFCGGAGGSAYHLTLPPAVVLGGAC